MKSAVLIFGFLVMTVPVAAQPVDHLSAHQAILLKWVQGEFSNQRQVNEGTNALADAPLAADTAPDLLFPDFRHIPIPGIEGDVVYLQWHIGSPKGKLQRQRIWVFKADPARNAVMMKFYTLKNPEAWVDAHLTPDNVRGMTLDDLIPYPATCDLPFRRHGDVFIGDIPLNQCKIIAQQTKIAMTINSHTVIGPDKIWYQEFGVNDANSALVFKVPRLGAFEFDRR